MERRQYCIVFLFTMLVPAARAQSAARYRVMGDTLRYERDNPYRMYWVRGAGTTGAPRHERSIESHLWRGSAAHPAIVIRRVALDVERSTSSDTFTISPDGRVAAINHRTPNSSQRVDLLLHLPAVPLRAGVEWTDTLRTSGTDAAGAEHYDVLRDYRVVRILDTLGATNVADVIAHGTISMRFGFWVDSAAHRAAWIDVRGPVTERYLFDAVRGRLLRRRWDMDLRGRGVAPGATDTVAAGLRSVEVLELDDSPRARFLLDPLPGADSAMTIDLRRRGAILLHTVDRAPDRITSSFARNDGMVGVAIVTLRTGVLQDYQATWADTMRTLRVDRITRHGDSLVLQRPGGRDTSVAIPAGPWGVADYSMEELLVPLLLTVPRDGAPHAISVFRPYPERWERGTATATNRAGLVLVVLRFEPENEPLVMLVTPEGDFLYGEDGVPAKAQRVPMNQSRMERVMPVLQGRQSGPTEHQ